MHAKPDNQWPNSKSALIANASYLSVTQFRCLLLRLRHLAIEFMYLLGEIEIGIMRNKAQITKWPDKEVDEINKINKCNPKTAAPRDERRIKAAKRTRPFLTHRREI